MLGGFPAFARSSELFANEFLHLRPAFGSLIFFLHLRNQSTVFHADGNRYSEWGSRKISRKNAAISFEVHNIAVDRIIV